MEWTCPRCGIKLNINKLSEINIGFSSWCYSDPIYSIPNAPPIEKVAYIKRNNLKSHLILWNGNKTWVQVDSSESKSCVTF